MTIIIRPLDKDITVASKGFSIADKNPAVKMLNPKSKNTSEYILSEFIERLTSSILDVSINKFTMDFVKINDSKNDIIDKISVDIKLNFNIYFMDFLHILP